MHSPFTPTPAQAASFQIGDVVVNFNVTGKVIGYHRDGESLILREVGKRMKWVADPQKCKAVAA